MKISVLRPDSAMPLPLAIGGLLLIALALLPGADTERAEEEVPAEPPAAAQSQP